MQTSPHQYDPAKFIAGLKRALTDAPLDERQAAIRRCIDDITIDRERMSAIIAIRKIPAVTGGPAVNEVEHINAALSISPAPLA